MNDDKFKKLMQAIEQEMTYLRDKPMTEGTLFAVAALQSVYNVGKSL